MRNRLPLQASAMPFLVVLLIVLSGCGRNPSPVESEKKPDAGSATVAPPRDATAPSQQQTAETGKDGPATATTRNPEVTTVTLPAPIDDLRIGAGGKLMILRLKKLAKLAVIDVIAGKIAGYVTLGDPQEQRNCWSSVGKVAWPSDTHWST